MYVIFGFFVVYQRKIYKLINYNSFFVVLDKNFEQHCARQLKTFVVRRVGIHSIIPLIYNFVMSKYFHFIILNGFFK